MIDENWIKNKDNQKKVIGLLIGIDLLAISGLLIITASSQGPLYEVIKPEVEQEYYIYVNHEINQHGRIILSVIPTDSNMNVIGKEKHISLPREYKQFQMHCYSPIMITRITQFTGEEEITISSYNPNLNILSLS